jgi:hypothetical protein
MNHQLINAALLMSCWACAGSPSPTAPPVIEALRISAPSSLEAGATAQLSAVTVLSDGTSAPLSPSSVLWQSSDTVVGNISSTGVLSALESGVVGVQGSYRQWTSLQRQVTVTRSESGAPPVKVGERVEDALCCENGSFAIYAITAPSDGTLVVQLSWDSNKGRLELYLDDAHFNNSNNSPPVVGKLPVLAGRIYRIRVVDGAPWDYGGMNVPFVLTASIE